MASTARTGLWIAVLFAMVFGGIPSNAWGQAEKPLTTHPALDSFPAPSRDGRFLAFVSERSGNPDIWLKTLTKGAYTLPRQLTHYSGQDGAPSLNARGSHLLYVSHKTDPRGDIYLLDVFTGKESRLTGIDSSDSSPVWGSAPQTMYYLKENAIGDVQGLFRYSLQDHTQQLLVAQASSFSVGPDSWIVYSDGRKLKAIKDPESDVPIELTTGASLDLWPSFINQNTIAFTRYEEDSNGDGQVDTNDESSIWLSRWDFFSHRQEALYRVTPAREFHVYPSGGSGFLYYSDLQRGDIFRMSLSEFFHSYDQLEHAQALAAVAIDKGRTEQALLLMTNISHNLIGSRALSERAEFDFAFVELLREGKRFLEARAVLDRYADAKGRLGALYRIHSLSLGVERQADRLSRKDIGRVVTNMSKQLLHIGKEHSTDPTVRGVARLEAGKLFILADQPLVALKFLTKIESNKDTEVRAKALFTRGKIYQSLGEESQLLQVFVDVLTLFGEDSSWGKRAVVQAIAVSEQQEDFRQKIASLSLLPDRYAHLPFLSASALLRVAELYEQEGELLKALDTLDRVIAEYSTVEPLLVQAYRRKGHILTAAQRFQEAADSYATLVTLSGVDQDELKEAQRHMVLQLVRSAVKQRSIGEVRIAAKQLKNLVVQHPDSVEGHRRYIETKSMLKQTDEVRERYRGLSTQFPQNAIYQYAWGFAETYATSPDFSRIVGRLEEAIKLDAGISYFHQTLGWAYEQMERKDPQQGYLEQAEQEYRIALELNDGFQFPQVEGNLLLNLGNTYMALGNYDEAYRHYQKREGLNLPAKDDVNELLFQKSFGTASFKSGKTDESIRHYQRALQLVSDTHSERKAQLLERIGLSYQDTRDYTKAVQYFSEALKLNLESGHTQNLALLKRNIGVNLYNLSLVSEEVPRDALKDALKSYFSSLEAIKQYGGQEQSTGSGLLQLDFALGEGGSGASGGFDQRGEQKLMFSYIANTYEQLDEPNSAKAFYQKKLALFPEEDSSDSSIAERTEKAVVLNRLGILSHQLGQPGEARDYFHRSLQHTRDMGLDYGTTINLYNISRVASEERLHGHPTEQETVQLLRSVLDEVLDRGNVGKLSALTLANVGFLLADLPIPTASVSTVLYDSTREFYWVYEAKKLAVSYYKRAISILEGNSALTPTEKVPLLLNLKMNLMELARQAGKRDHYRSLQQDLYRFVEQSHAPQNWVLSMLEAEHATSLEEKEELLQQAFDGLMALPLQAYEQKDSHTGLLHLYDAFSMQYVDLLVKKRAFERAFHVAEQIHMRKVASQLYDRLGGQFFLQGIGDYEDELRILLREMRTARGKNDRKGLTSLKVEFDELIFALLEDYPWAVSFFTQYVPTGSMYSMLLSPEQPYIKTVVGYEGTHVFIHNGNEVKYVTVSSGSSLDDNSDMDKVSRVYLSDPSTITDSILPESILEKPISRVLTFYDVLNAYTQRSLVYSHVGVTGDLDLSAESSGNPVPITVDRFQAVSDHDSHLLERLNVFVASGLIKDLSFGIKTELGVREAIPLHKIPSDSKHSAILLNRSKQDSLESGVLASALIRAGFPHVIMNQGVYEPHVAEHVTSSYLSLLATLRPDQAVRKAVQSLDRAEGSTPTFDLYGYAGMDREEKIAYAASVYSNALDEGVELYQAKDYANARQRFERALSLNPFTSFQDDISQLTTLAVDASFKMKDYTKAVIYQEQLLHHVEQTKNHDEEPEALYRLGILYSRLEQYEPAITYLNRAITLWEEREELDRLAEGISSLGVVQENMGAYSDALKAFGRSFHLYQELGEPEFVAGEYKRIGRIYYLRLGRYEQAKKSFQAALALYRELDRPKAQAETLYDLGLTFEKIGLFDEADIHYRKGMMIGKQLEDPLLLATGELYLANTQWFRGQYQQAFTHLAVAEQQSLHAKDPQLPIMIANTKGLIYWTLNEIDKGLIHVHKALDIAQREDIQTEVASSQNNLGLMYREQGDIEASLVHFHLAKDIDTQLDSQWGLGYDHRNIGISLMKVQRYTEAEAHFTDAERISAKIHNTTNWVKTLLELGHLHRTLDQREKADTYYTEAFTRSKQFGVQEVVWRAAAGKAALLNKGGKKEEAFSWYSQAVNIVEGMRATLKIEEFKNSFQLNKQDLYLDIITLLVEMGRTEEAFNYVERSRSRSFIDLLGNQKLTLKNDLDQQQLESINRLSLQVEALGQEVGSFETPPKELLARHRQAKIAHEEALILLKQSNPGLSSFVAVDPLTQTQVEQLLSPDVGLLSYKLTEEQIFLWVIKSEGTSFYSIPLRDQNLTETITRYRGLVQRLEPVAAELEQLYALLVQPVEQDLQGLQYLGIIPDDVLHFLSFSALKNSTGYLIDRMPLFYTPSASVLKFTFAKRRNRKQTKVLAVGNPDLGDFNYDLPLAELEAKSIRWNFPEMDILTGITATKEWFTQNISKYGIIHLAAHGEFDELNPLLSSLWLASSDPDNRRLTVKEVFGLDIRADLVTLSACQTGLGKLEAGELIGLNRAFLYAGTHALVSTLWRVDDLSTSVLMKHFYRTYAFQDKAQSLRQAQLIVKKDFPHPSYWAGMSLVGDYQ